MLLGTVEGNIWSTRSSPALLAKPFPTVGGGHQLPFCADGGGAGEGERVLVATGGAARVAAGKDAPVDAAVVGIVDQSQP